MVMITKEQAYNTISDLNERAHSITWDQWEEAADNEELREEASLAQQDCFRVMFYDLDEDMQDAIWQYVGSDENFEEDFLSWYGED